MATDTKKTVSTSIREEKSNKPPKGATITREDVTTRSEEIQNGWLLTKNHSGRYKLKDSKSDYDEYFDYDEKWYSKTDPLTITVNDASLADAFDDDGD